MTVEQQPTEIQRPPLICKKKAAFLALIAVAILLVVWTGSEPFARLPLTNFMSWKYTDREGEYCTRTTLDAQGTLLRIERVHLASLPNGGTGDVDGILKQTVYGVPLWGGASRPIITYDVVKQTVTKHSRGGDKTYTAEEFGATNGFEIEWYRYGEVAGLFNICESSNWLAIFWHHFGPYVPLLLVPLKFLDVNNAIGASAWLQFPVVLLACVFMFRYLRRRHVSLRRILALVGFTYILSTVISSLAIIALKEILK